MQFFFYNEFPAQLHGYYKVHLAEQLSEMVVAAQMMMPPPGSSIEPQESMDTVSLPKPAASSLPFLLAKNCCPIPGKLVAKIQALQFVDMRELLPDNIALSERLATLPQTMQLARAQQHSIGQREVSSITSWACAFVTYIAIVAQARPELVIGRLAYLCNIMREAYRVVGGDGWRTYDHVFRNQAAADHSLDWSEMVPSLSLAYIQPTGMLPRVPCPLCQESDHTAHNCALAPLAHPSQTQHPKTPQPPQQPSNNKLPSRLPDGSQLCISWNQGACSAPGPYCRYKHICGSCGEDHIARDCRQTSDSSIFKRPPKRPARS